MTLAANLIIFANDVSLNPGPGSPLPSEMKGLRVFHLNIRSLRNKMDELQLFCDGNKPHVLSLNETWLDDSFSDSELCLPGYQLFRKDRDCHGGGIAVYVAENLSCNCANSLQGDSNIESLWFEVSQRCSKKILFGAIWTSKC